METLNIEQVMQNSIDCFPPPPSFGCLERKTKNKKTTTTVEKFRKSGSCYSTGIFHICVWG